MAFIYNTPIEGEMISFGRNQMGKDISQISEFAFEFAALDELFRTVTKLPLIVILSICALVVVPEYPRLPHAVAEAISEVYTILSTFHTLLAGTVSVALTSFT